MQIVLENDEDLWEYSHQIYEQQWFTVSEIVIVMKLSKLHILSNEPRICHQKCHFNDKLITTFSVFVMIRLLIFCFSSSLLFSIRTRVWGNTPYIQSIEW